ncbi:3-carboxy-cis,cis-muconate cycloisomerase [Streptomyces sp. F63]|uniref:3-carboxy-cis,cis-muconate cycloisomerase n=1 Tax=Streptomyces sp. F63 TaxID=2824887 RepID=UPI001B36A756|nr:3-carboxy-cis,cis-muconate cycloisomerase [Streptomyces sp. F63]MBQ0985684.1 3-carboxy-cis,cis-muconate cycloisomerase [Streptomyces sp. F63]
MNSPEPAGTTGAPPPAGAGDDTGLLSPVRAGTAAEAATGDRAWLAALLDAEAALTRAQAALGLAPREAADAVDRAVREGEFDVRDLALRARAGGNPVIPLVRDLTAAVRKADPGAAAYVHRGATSQDILDTATMLVAARTLPLILADLERAAGALGRLAARHRATPMPGRTLTQHAVPTTFGLKAAGWRALLLDAHDRLAALLDGGLPAQLGGAAGTLAAFGAYARSGGGEGGAGDAGTAAPGRGGEDPPGPGTRIAAEYARELGLAEPALPWHTLRTPVADLAAALSFTAGALGKLAADVLVLSRTEIGEVAEGTGGGSSAMPHKANPARSVLIASVARQVPALAAVLLGSLAAEDERPGGAWHAEWQPLREALRLTGGAAEAAAGLAEGLHVRPERMRAHLDLTGGLVVSERLTAELAPLLGRAEAAGLLGDAARRATERGTGLWEALLAEPAVRNALSEERLRELTDPAGYTGEAAALTVRALRRTPRRRPGGPSSPGSPSPSSPSSPEEQA